MNDVTFDKDLALDKAMHMFWRVGYRATSLNHLLGEMEILNGSFYNTFGSKKQIFDQCVERYRETVLQPRMDAFLLEKEFRASIRAFFNRIIQDFSSRRTPKGCLIVNTLAGESDQQQKKAVERIALELKDFLFQKICLAVSNDEIELSSSPESVASLLLTFIEGIAVAHRAGESPQSLQTQITLLLKSTGL